MLEAARGTLEEPAIFAKADKQIANRAEPEKPSEKISANVAEPQKPTEKISANVADPEKPASKVSANRAEPQKPIDQQQVALQKPSPEVSAKSAETQKPSHNGPVDAGFQQHLDSLGVDTQMEDTVPDEQLEAWRREPSPQREPEPVNPQPPRDLLAAKTEQTPSPKKSASGAPVSDGSVPLLSDKGAPQPKVGEPTLSKAAIDQTARRIFTLRANGQKKVSQHVWDEWHKGKGSKERMNLEQIFARCGYSHDCGLASISQYLA